MWNEKKVSVVLPTYNEKDSIRATIEALFELDFVDEVLVVDNNAVDGTREECEGSGARIVHERRQGYGWSMRRGLSEAIGDVIVVMEPDGTFEPRDIVKLLAYSHEFDVVYGSRTSRQLIWSGANMGFFLRWGNWAVAKLVEVLYDTSNLTDVGCTMRLIHRDALDEIKPYFRTGGNHFSPEMMVLSALCGQRMIQIPVNYKQRVGESSATGKLSAAIDIGVRMIVLILVYRVRGWFGRPFGRAS